MLCCIFVNDTVFAVEFGQIKYNNAYIDYSKIDQGSTRELADFYFEKALKTRNKDERKSYLQKASAQYFILNQINPKDLYPIVQLARVYDYEDKNMEAILRYRKS